MRNIFFTSLFLLLAFSANAEHPCSNMCQFNAYYKGFNVGKIYFSSKSTNDLKEILFDSHTDFNMLSKLLGAKSIIEKVIARQDKNKYVPRSYIYKTSKGKIYNHSFNWQSNTLNVAKNNENFDLPLIQGITDRLSLSFSLSKGMPEKTYIVVDKGRLKTYQLIATKKETILRKGEKLPALSYTFRSLEGKNVPVSGDNKTLYKYWFNRELSSYMVRLQKFVGEEETLRLDSLLLTSNH